MFVKLRPGVDSNDACAKLSCEFADLMPVRQYRARLDHTYGMMYTYIDIVNGIALVIAFLFIMITLYMMVLQRTRVAIHAAAAGALVSGLYPGWRATRVDMVEALTNE